MSKPSPPIHYLLALYPCFQLLDVAGPLDILNLLGLTHPPAADITLTLIASTLDPVPTKPIPPVDPTTNQPRYTFSGLPEINGTTNTRFNQYLVPDVTYSSYLTALREGSVSNDPSAKHKPIDVLLIPGGIGARITRVDPATGESTSNVADLLDFIPQIAARVRHSIITVCTGSDILAQTGLLNTRRATSNMSWFDTVASRSPKVHWQKARRWVRSSPDELDTTTTTDPSTTQHQQQQQQLTESQKHLDPAGTRTTLFQGEIWTSAGISAGIDVTLAFVAAYYGGVDVAREASRKLEYEWREIPEGAVDPMYGLKLEDLGRWKGGYVKGSK